MRTPRIGDTVHYTAHPPNEPECWAAIIVKADTHNGKTNLRVLEPNASVSFGVHDIPADPANGWEDFTPGTWHHTH